MLQTCIANGADESKLRTAFVRLPPSMTIEDRIVAAWRVATGMDPAPDETIRTLPTRPPVEHPVPGGPFPTERAGYTLRDWLLGWGAVAGAIVTVVALITSHC